MNTKTFFQTLGLLVWIIHAFSECVFAMDDFNPNIEETFLKNETAPHPNAIRAHPDGPRTQGNRSALRRSIIPESGVSVPYSFFVKKKILPEAIQEKIGSPVYVLSFEKILNFAYLNVPHGEAITQRLIEASQSSDKFLSWLHDEIEPNISKYFCAWKSPYKVVQWFTDVFSTFSHNSPDVLQFALNAFVTGKDQEVLRQIAILFFVGLEHFQSKHPGCGPIQIKYDAHYCVEYVELVNLLVPGNYPGWWCGIIHLQNPNEKNKKTVSYLSFHAEGDVIVSDLESIEAIPTFWHEISHAMHFLLGIDQRQASILELSSHPWLKAFFFPNLTENEIESTRQAITKAMQDKNPKRFAQILKRWVKFSEDYLLHMCPKDRERFEALRDTIRCHGDAAFQSTEVIQACVDLLLEIVYPVSLWLTPEEVFQVAGLCLDHENNCIIINPFCDNVFWKNKRCPYINSEDAECFRKDFPFFQTLPSKDHIRTWLELLGLDFDVCVPSKQED